MMRITIQEAAIFIFRELWKCWCSIKYGNNRISVSRVRQEVLFHLKIYMRSKGVFIDMSWSWLQLCNHIERYRPTISSRAVIWDKPPDGWLKINIDGSSQIRTKIARIGGIVRNKNGELIMAFAKNLQFCSNNQPEVQAA